MAMFNNQRVGIYIYIIYIYIIHIYISYIYIYHTYIYVWYIYILYIYIIYIYAIFATALTAWPEMDRVGHLQLAWDADAVRELGVGKQHPFFWKGEWDGFIQGIVSYPLVNIQKTTENHHFIAGKINYYREHYSIIAIIIMDIPYYNCFPITVREWE